MHNMEHWSISSPGVADSLELRIYNQEVGEHVLGLLQNSKENQCNISLNVRKEEHPQMLAQNIPQSPNSSTEYNNKYQIHENRANSFPTLAKNILKN